MASVKKKALYIQMSMVQIFLIKIYLQRTIAQLAYLQQRVVTTT
jgi:hypothetical protein